MVATAVEEPKRAAVGSTYTIGDETFVVQESCGSSHGRWICTSHGELFRNQLGKDSHIAEHNYACILAWMCMRHGGETP